MGCICWAGAPDRPHQHVPVRECDRCERCGQGILHLQGCGCGLAEVGVLKPWLEAGRSRPLYFVLNVCTARDFKCTVQTLLKFRRRLFLFFSPSRAEDMSARKALLYKHFSRV